MHAINFADCISHMLKNNPVESLLIEISQNISFKYCRFSLISVHRVPGPAEANSTLIGSLQVN